VPGGQPSNYQSISLNGSTAYVEAPNSTSLNITGSAITLEAWVKMPVTNTGSYQIILEKAPASGTEGGYELCITDQGKARIDIYYGAYYVGLIGNTVLSANTWHHVAGVYNGSQLQIYVDGALDNSLSTSVTITSTSVSLLIGESRYPYGHSYFNGLIDEVRISNAAVYTANFTPQTHLTASGSTKGLWKFDGSTPNDSSGNGNNGTLNGGATYSTDVPSGDGGGGSGGGGGGSTPVINYVLSDLQGSARALMNNNGVGTSTVVARHDYLQFGEEIGSGTGLRTPSQGYGATDTNRWKYGMTERDTTTGLDHTWLRKYESTAGRWTSPDPLSGNVGDPQSLNAFTYAANDPVNLIDPSGLMPSLPDASHGWDSYSAGFWGSGYLGGNGWGNDPHPGMRAISNINWTYQLADAGALQRCGLTHGLATRSIRAPTRMRIANRRP
jgi:RHS repeat-associated protein